MDTSDYARKLVKRGQQLSDFDLRGYSNRELLNWLAYTKPDAFKELAEEISKGNFTLKNQILRRWGIW